MWGKVITEITANHQEALGGGGEGLSLNPAHRPPEPSDGLREVGGSEEAGPLVWVQETPQVVRRDGTWILTWVRVTGLGGPDPVVLVV